MMDGSAPPLRSRPPPWRAMVAAAVLLGSACEPAAEDPLPRAIPPEAQMEVSDPGGADLERAYPITDDDVGDLVIATGFVVGNPGPEGFFLQTEAGQVILVRSPSPASVGQAVRAVGPVREAPAARFAEWERELLGEVDPEWELIPSYYIEATRVVPAAGP